MSIKIQREDLFKNKLLTGICLFTGAGFSTLESPSGKKLPTGGELCEELIEKFNLTGVSKEDGLSYISEFCPDSEYQDYLRQRFTVDDYNPLYNAITKIKLRTVITTNIDNIIRKVVDNSETYYIQNIREYGAPSYASNELVYVPVHGDVVDQNSRLFFGKFELSNADAVNSDLFRQMYALLADKPVLFWGYGFNDPGVLKVAKELIEKWNSNIWVQLMPGDEKNKRLFEEKGCHVIEATTCDLLEWIADALNEEPEHCDCEKENNKLKKYRVPSLTQVATVPTKEFYQQGNTDWYPILTGETFERSLVSNVENIALKNKNVIISGGRFTGKTTVLMQLARKVSSSNKYYAESLTKEEAVFIRNSLGKETAWFFFNNCCRDVDAFLELAQADNIKLIGTSDEYLLETVRHLLSQNTKYTTVDCNELSQSEAMRMYQKIPTGMRMPNFVYKKDADDKYSVFEFVAYNVRDAYTKNHVAKMFEDLYATDNDSFKIVALTSYLSDNGSAVSYSNIAHLLNISIYPNAMDKLRSAINYLRQYNIEVEETAEQDYFVLRSKIFALNARQILIEKYRKEFADIVRFFALEESNYNILRYDIFRRKGFDAELFHKLFTYDEAVCIYKDLFNIDENPYTLQQLALCRGLFGDYTNAFADIDKAVNSRPRNFSFKNSQAILLFESNNSNYSEGSLAYMKQAMTMLEECYNNDKRKIYHAQKYAKFSIIMSESYGCDDYLEKAQQWLLETNLNDGSKSYTTKSLLEKLGNLLS